MGNNNTHIVNKYECAHSIVAVWTHEKLNVDHKDLSLLTNVQAIAKGDIIVRFKYDELVRIPFRESQAKMTGSSKYYLTVIACDETRKVLTMNYEIQKDRSYIVTKHGDLKLSQYDNIWKEAFS